MSPNLESGLVGDMVLLTVSKGLATSSYTVPTIPVGELFVGHGDHGWTVWSRWGLMTGHGFQSSAVAVRAAYEMDAAFDWPNYNLDNRDEQRRVCRLIATQHGGSLEGGIPTTEAVLARRDLGPRSAEIEAPEAAS